MSSPTSHPTESASHQEHQSDPEELNQLRLEGQGAFGRWVSRHQHVIGPLQWLSLQGFVIGKRVDVANRTHILNSEEDRVYTMHLLDLSSKEPSQELQAVINSLRELWSDRVLKHDTTNSSLEQAPLEGSTVLALFNTFQCGQNPQRAYPQRILAFAGAVAALYHLQYPAWREFVAANEHIFHKYTSQRRLGEVLRERMGKRAEEAEHFHATITDLLRLVSAGDTD